MIKDKFIGEYLKRVMEERHTLQVDISKANFSSLYDVGRVQGQVAGLDKAIQLLEAMYEEQDI